MSLLEIFLCCPHVSPEVCDRTACSPHSSPWSMCRTCHSSRGGSGPPGPRTGSTWPWPTCNNVTCHTLSDVLTCEGSRAQPCCRGCDPGQGSQWAQVSGDWGWGAGGDGEHDDHDGYGDGALSLWQPSPLLAQPQKETEKRSSNDNNFCNGSSSWQPSILKDLTSKLLILGWSKVHYAAPGSRVSSKHDNQDIKQILIGLF